MQKIVVKFVGEEVGDPLLQFNLLTSNGLSAFQQSEALNYVLVGRSEGLNKTQRVFEFDLQPSLRADPALLGDLIQFVQIVATASDGGQAGEISEARWNSLPEEDRGDILYFRREAAGVLREVDPDAYQAIADPEERGPIKYYRRERPRLAEIEVWSAGDNISLGTVDRGGRMVGFGNSGNEFRTIDGDYPLFLGRTGSSRRWQRSRRCHRPGDSLRLGYLVLDKSGLFRLRRRSGQRRIVQCHAAQPHNKFIGRHPSTGRQFCLRAVGRPRPRRGPGSGGGEEILPGQPLPPHQGALCENRVPPTHLEVDQQQDTGDPALWPRIYSPSIADLGHNRVGTESPHSLQHRLGGGHPPWNRSDDPHPDRGQDRQEDRVFHLGWASGGQENILQNAEFSAGGFADYLYSWRRLEQLEFALSGDRCGPLPHPAPGATR